MDDSNCAEGITALAARPPSMRARCLHRSTRALTTFSMKVKDLTSPDAKGLAWPSAGSLQAFVQIPRRTKRLLIRYAQVC